MIERFSSFCDHVIVGGGIANTFLLASGKQVGASLVETEMVDAANKILQMENVNVPLPVDVRVAKEFSTEAEASASVENSFATLTSTGRGTFTFSI